MHQKDESMKEDKELLKDQFKKQEDHNSKMAKIAEGMYEEIKEGNKIFKIIS